MEIYNISNDIEVFYIAAEKFPEGIEDAYNKLNSVINKDSLRMFFGISYPDENGNIIYKAAARELFPGEKDQYDLPGFTIKKGDYISSTVKNWKNDVTQISNIFRELLNDERIDENGYCLEMYVNNDAVICMVPLEPAQ